MDERTERVVADKIGVSRFPSFFALIERVAGVIDTSLNYIAVSITLALMLMVITQVTLRYFFNRPLIAYIDVLEMMMAVLVFLSLSYTHWKGGNIRMDYFMTKVLKEGRLYWVFEFLFQLLSLLGLSLIAVYTLKQALHGYAAHDVTMSAYLPMWPAKLLVAIGAIAFCIRLTIQSLQSLARAATGARGSK